MCSDGFDCSDRSLAKIQNCCGTRWKRTDPKRVYKICNFLLSVCSHHTFFSGHLRSKFMFFLIISNPILVNMSKLAWFANAQMLIIWSATTLFFVMSLPWMCRYVRFSSTSIRNFNSGEIGQGFWGVFVAQLECMTGSLMYLSIGSMWKPWK